jgi:hypothetical protein
VGREEDDGHPAPEDIARMAEGSVTGDERLHLIRHLNRCAACYDTLQSILPHADSRTSAPWWKTRGIYALAASLVLVVLIGGNLLQRYGGDASGPLIATLTVDDELRRILTENDALYWPEGDRVERLGALLRQRGIDAKNLKAAMLTGPYSPTKSLFGPKEVLKVRIEEGVAHLEIVREEP